MNLEENDLINFKNILILKAYIDQSRYRTKVINYLTEHTVATPTEIAKGTGIRVNHISKVLKELKDKEVIKCLNEEMKKGRLYYITQLGKEIINIK